MHVQKVDNPLFIPADQLSPEFKIKIGKEEMGATFKKILLFLEKYRLFKRISDYFFLREGENWITKNSDKIEWLWSEVNDVEQKISKMRELNLFDRIDPGNELNYQEPAVYSYLVPEQVHKTWQEELQERLNSDSSESSDSESEVFYDAVEPPPLHEVKHPEDSFEKYKGKIDDKIIEMIKSDIHDFILNNQFEDQNENEWLERHLQGKLAELNHPKDHLLYLMHTLIKLFNGKFDEYKGKIEQYNQEVISEMPFKYRVLRIHVLLDWYQGLKKQFDKNKKVSDEELTALLKPIDAALSKLKEQKINLIFKAIDGTALINLGKLVPNRIINLAFPVVIKSIIFSSIEISPVLPQEQKDYIVNNKKLFGEMAVEIAEEMIVPAKIVKKALSIIKKANNNQRAEAGREMVEFALEFAKDATKFPLPKKEDVLI